jgi:hypothetical protein
VQWESGQRRGAPTFTLRVTAPRGTSGQIAVPAPANPAAVRATLDGHPVAIGAAPHHARLTGGALLLDDIGAGEHELLIH